MGVRSGKTFKKVCHCGSRASTSQHARWSQHTESKVVPGDGWGVEPTAAIKETYHRCSITWQATPLRPHSLQCLPRISALFFRSASGLLEFEARRVLNLYTQQSPLPSQDQAHNLGWWWVWDRAKPSRRYATAAQEPQHPVLRSRPKRNTASHCSRPASFLA